MVMRRSFSHSYITVSIVLIDLVYTSSLGVQTVKFGCPDWNPAGMDDDRFSHFVAHSEGSQEKAGVVVALRHVGSGIVQYVAYRNRFDDKGKLTNTLDPRIE
jgi:hypothetical protein